MENDRNRTVVVTGASGLQGSAVTRQLLAEGWTVRALTRTPQSEKARALSALGAEVVQGDMEDPATLAPVFAGAYGVFSVQNPVLSGVEREIRQGKNVADAARQAGVRHVVYSSAGPDVPGTGVPSWESKRVIEQYMKSLELPLTVLRPMAFMELMTEQKFFPAVSTWQVMPAVMGSDRKVVWVCTRDLACVVSRVLAEPGNYIGNELPLASDAKTIAECRAIYREVTGKAPPRFPMPVWLFRRFGFIGKDLTTMWRWLRSQPIPIDTGTLKTIHPGALTVREWLEKPISAGR